MDLRYEIRRRLYGAIAPGLCVLAIVYFAYHIVQGDRGLIAYAKLHQEVQRGELALSLARAEREELELRTDLLHPERIDPDMLDERARAVLGLVHPNDVIIPTD